MAPHQGFEVLDALEIVELSTEQLLASRTYGLKGQPDAEVSAELVTGHNTVVAEQRAVLSIIPIRMRVCIIPILRKRS